MKPAQGEPIASATGARCPSPHRAPNLYARIVRAVQNAITRKAIRAERAKAVAELQAAIRGGDTRKQHATFKAAREATNRALGAGA